MAGTLGGGACRNSTKSQQFRAESCASLRRREVVAFAAQNRCEAVLSRHTSSPTVRPMLARVTTFAIDGLASRRITVEVDLRSGLPAFTIVGRGDAAVRESRERVHARCSTAASSSRSDGSRSTSRPRTCARSAPASTWRPPAACWPPPSRCRRASSSAGRCSASSASAARCATAAACSRRRGRARAGIAGLIVPRECAREAALVDGIVVAGVTRLSEVAAILRGAPPPALRRRRHRAGRRRREPDLADVRGHAQAIRALTIAAAGGHNLLLSGPPGTGKTMLARCAAVDPAAAHAATRRSPSRGSTASPASTSAASSCAGDRSARRTTRSRRRASSAAARCRSPAR